MEFLTEVTTGLLNKGLDFEVTFKQVDGLEGVKTNVRLFDKLTGETLGRATKDSLEKALAEVLTTIAWGSGKNFGDEKLSVL